MSKVIKMKFNIYIDFTMLSQSFSFFWLSVLLTLIRTLSSQEYFNHVIILKRYKQKSS